MSLKKHKIFLFLLFVSFLGKAQDCVLDIGGEHYKTIERIFQLNEEQKQNVEEWRAQLSIEEKNINEEAAKLFETHPQDTPEELMVLGQKYNVLKQRLLDITVKYDKKLIGFFNEKQKERYAELCKAAARKPLIKGVK